MTNVIETAVAPLKNDAMDRAEGWAVKRIMDIKNELAVNDWNLDAVAPRGRSNQSRGDYQQANAKRQMYQTVTKTVSYGDSFSKKPTIVEANEAAEEKFIKSCREEAALQYDAFVAKLTKKVTDSLGEMPVSAELDGRAVWNRSELTVKAADGRVERWLTKTIVNVSPLGKYFNQWPTTKIK